MPRYLGRVVCAGLLLLALTTPIQGFDGCAPRVSAYYYPVYYYNPVVYYTPLPVCVTPPVPCTPTLSAPPLMSPYAPPTAAPPSPTHEPPRMPAPQRPPKITESRFRGLNAEAVVSTDKLSGECCMVGFWNLTDRSITITVEGQRHLLPRGHNVTLTQKRQFAWQLDQQPRQNEQVPADRTGVEILIRY